MRSPAFKCVVVVTVTFVDPIVVAFLLSEVNNEMIPVVTLTLYIYTSLVPIALAENPIKVDIIYLPANGVIICPLVAFTLIPPIFVVGTVKLLIIVTVLIGITVDPTGIGIGATPTVPVGMIIGVVVVMYVIAGHCCMGGGGLH